MGCEKTQISPYRPQANRLCEQLNRTLGDTLQTMIAETGSNIDQWYLLLPQLMRNIHSVHHTATGETAIFHTLDRKVGFPDGLLHKITSTEKQTVEACARQLQQRLHTAHQMLRDKQLWVRIENSKEPLLFKNGDLVWLKSYQRKKSMARACKLQPKFIGPYKITEGLPYNTYRLARDGNETIEHEGQIKLDERVANQFDDQARANPPPTPLTLIGRRCLRYADCLFTRVHDVTVSTAKVNLPHVISTLVRLSLIRTCVYIFNAKDFMLCTSAFLNKFWCSVTPTLGRWHII